MNAAAPQDGNVKFAVTPKMGNGEKPKSFFFRVKMSVDLWTMGSVAIHLRQGYGGQDVKVLPVPIFNVE